MNGCQYSGVRFFGFRSRRLRVGPAPIRTPMWLSTRPSGRAHASGHAGDRCLDQCPLSDQHAHHEAASPAGVTLGVQEPFWEHRPSRWIARLLHCISIPQRHLSRARRPLPQSAHRGQNYPHHRRMVCLAPSYNRGRPTTWTTFGKPCAQQPVLRHRPGGDRLRHVRLPGG